MSECQSCGREIHEGIGKVCWSPDGMTMCSRCYAEQYGASR